MTRPSIPQNAETSVLASSRRRCSLCFGLRGDREVKTGQIAHIDQDPSNNSTNNLIFLCFDHHDAYDSATSQSKGFTIQELKYYRDLLYSYIESILPIHQTSDSSSLGDIPLIVPLKEKFHDEAILELRESIQSLVSGGFAPEEDIAQIAVNSLSDEYDSESLKPYAKLLTQEHLAMHKQEQETWPADTDCDRLDLAFAELERSGIVCRHDYQDCQSCGYAKIRIEIDQSGKDSVRGFTFYHQQDTDRVGDSGTLCLCYGSTQGGEEEAIAIGQEITSVLQRHGFKVDWNGQLGKRIMIEIDWQKRR